MSGRAALVLLAGAVAWLPGAPSNAGDVTDATALYRAEARWHAATGRPTHALSVLRARGIDRGPLTAKLYARLGLVGAARAALDGHADAPGATEAALTLAERRLERGDAPAAEAILAAMPTPADDDSLRRHASLSARAALRGDNAFEAMQALALAREETDLPPVDRYNLAMAQLRLGAAEDGARLLEELGDYGGDHAVRRALADRANLALGYWLLDHRRPAAARERFVRVRMNGPASRRALLGLGWAELQAIALPQVITNMDPRSCRPQARDDLWADDAARRGTPRWECRLRRYDQHGQLLDFVHLRMGDATQYERAIVAWRTTADGAESSDPVAAEAIASLPYALAAAGDEAGAVAGFREAIEQLRAARSDLAHREPDAQPAPGSPLARVAADLESVSPMLDASRRRLARLRQPAPSARRAREDIGAILAELRPPDGGNGSLAAPNPVQRARLRTGLAALEADTAARREAADKLNILARRIERQAARRAEIESGIAARALQDDGQWLDRLHSRLGEYLKQARLGLATVSSH